MKKNILAELSQKTSQELKKELQDKREAWSKTKLEIFSGKSKNTAVLKEIKKDIARITMYIHQKVEGKK